MRLPRVVIYADSVSIADGETVTLFEEVSPIERIGAERIPLKTTLRRYTTDRVDGVWLARYINEDRIGPEMSAYASPGLDFWVEDINMVAHAEERIKWTARNESGADVTLTYRFYMEQEEDDGMPIKQHIWQNTLTLGAMERDVLMAEFRARLDKVIIVYSLAFDRNTNLRVFAYMDERIISPMDGFNCGAARGIERDMKVSYIVEPGSTLVFTVTNMTAASQTFPFRILAVEIPVEHEAEFGVKTLEETIPELSAMETEIGGES